ncbi:EamA-like transporter family protein [Hasllibacter halocynthiae]|uniref:EamA-like transporter family protein n=1 Tax=Hasllibacter halocynthiae TaxID=595589 RepID=A0A2T0X431_9RHOB|nr:EamA family transporter [Hasllibacter halocynthiae]PRY93699.1 EamA-like transporter family protein [Hasllibacter halocynthiae]
MTWTVFLAVLLAALLHAGWNAVVKGSSDKLAGMAAMAVGHAVPGGLAVLLFPPVDPAAWPWIAGSVALHFGYLRFLLLAYRLGDLSEVYPLARGSAPLLVALFSTVVLGSALSGMQLAAVAVIAAGILSIGLARRGRANPSAVAAALVTGVFIAAYSLMDGVGARVSGSPVAFFGWAALLGAIPFGLYAERRRPGLVLRLPRLAPAAFFGGGWASFTAYAIVVWAFTQAPIALVTALRETSIVFALLIGALVLRERVDLARIASTFVTLVGVALLRFAR